MHEERFIVLAENGERLDKPRVVVHRPLDPAARYRSHGPRDSYGCRICWPKTETTDSRKATE